MLKFEFFFEYEGREYQAECQPFPLDGTTDLHITPQDSELFDRFGVRVLAKKSDGSITLALPQDPEEHEYLLALADGASAYFDDDQKTIYQ